KKSASSTASIALKASTIFSMFCLKISSCSSSPVLGKGPPKNGKHPPPKITMPINAATNLVFMDPTILKFYFSKYRIVPMGLPQKRAPPEARSLPHATARSRRRPPGEQNVFFPYPCKRQDAGRDPRKAVSARWGRYDH